MRIQHVLAQDLDTQAAQPLSKTAVSIAGESCGIWDFSTPEVEAQRLASFVRSEMTAHELDLRDFALLVRQKADAYANILGHALASEGILLRNEAGMIGAVALQDLLSDEASNLIIMVLRLAATERAGEFWSQCLEAMAFLRGVTPDEEIAQTNLARELDAYALELKETYATPPTSKLMAKELVYKVLAFIGREQLIASHPAYGQGDWLDKVLDAVAEHLAKSAENGETWPSVLDAYEGAHAIPLMTIHKSKGLEYHTVIFVGLDDGAWWSFDQDKIEATATFFVAFTRAKQRVIFTYCADRGARANISPLYDLLSKSGVQTNQVA